MLNLISPGLLNLIFSMKKALNDQNSSKQNSQTLSPPFNAIWKTPLHLLLILTLINFAYCLLAILLDITPRQKNWVLPFSFMSHPISPLITDHILEKVSLIALIQILLKILSVVHILSFKIILIWKSSLELNLLVQNSVQQNYVPDLYPCIPQFTKKCITSFHLACCPYHVWTALPLSPNLSFVGNPVDVGRKNLAQQQKKPISHTGKIPLTKY